MDFCGGFVVGREMYKNLSGNSGVVSFETFAFGILIEWKGGGVYLYTYEKPGLQEVEEMKRLALAGKGLATYVNKFVRGKYAYRLG